MSIFKDQHRDGSSTLKNRFLGVLLRRHCRSYLKSYKNKERVYLKPRPQWKAH